MTKRLALIAAIAMLGPVSAYGQEATGGAPAAAKANPCNARRFETIVNFVADGKPRRSRVRICGEEGQSDQDWVRTLKDSLEKTAASTTLGEDAKTQIITALKAEIADVEAGMKQGALTNLIAVPPPAVTPQQPSPATRAPSPSVR